MEKPWLSQYDSGVPEEIEFPDIPLDQILTDTVKKYPDRTALIFFNNKITYAQLDKLVNQFASALQKDGFKKGDRIAIYMPNCPQFTIAYFGALRAGGVVVPSNPLYVPREIEHQVNDSGATYAVVLSLLYPRLKQVRANLNLKKVIVTNIKEYFPGVLKLLFTFAKENKPDQNGEVHRVNISNDADTVWLQDFLKTGTGSPNAVSVDGDDTAVLMYTGGTTGVPKGAQLTHKNLIANTLQISAWNTDGVPGESIMMTALPLTHSYSMTVSQNNSILNGFAQVIIPNPRDLDDVLKNLSKHRVEYFPGVPTLYVAINNHPDVKAGKYDLTSIKTCMSGAAGLPSEVQKEFMRITGGQLLEGYGLSETSPVACANPVSTGGQIGYIGVPVSNTLLRLVDVETGTKVMDIGEEGEICLSGPQIMQGYWNMPDETAKVLRTDEDGITWLYTGDIGVMEENGFTKIVDRKKDMIIAGGFNIYPNEVEEVLYQHPAVMEAAVIGVPDERRGEVVKAFVVLKDDQTSDSEEMRAWCKQEMRAYMVPKSIEFRDDLPKTMVGKILRRELRDEELKKSA
ncbi:MAG: long-chain fatty acid--CoA ligase [Chloroflexota bacterium]